jgi:hypothetical protein
MRESAPGRAASAGNRDSHVGAIFPAAMGWSATAKPANRPVTTMMMMNR